MIDKETVFNQLIEADDLVDLLDITREQADQIIELAHKHLELDGYIAIPNKVPIKILLDLLQIKDDEELPSYLL